MQSNKVVFLLAGLLIFSFLTPSARAEDMTITTYYPSPNGTYDALSVKRLSVGDTNADGSVNASDVSASSGYLLVSDKIGIGTVSPTSQLTIYNNNESATLTNFTQLLTNAGIQISTDYSASAYTPGIFWQTANNNATRPKAGIWLLEDGNGTDMYFGTSNNYATGITNNGLVLDQSGNVGIGTTAPAGHAPSRKALIVADTTNDALLEVWGSASGKSIFQSVGGSTYVGNLAAGTGAGNLFLTYGAGTTGIFMNGTSGNVGIGTTSPGSLLTVYGTTNWGVGEIIGNGSNVETSLGFRSSNVAKGASGNWLIGTNVGGRNIGGFEIYSAGGGVGIDITTAGNVGIGTSAPNANMKLQVAGEICSSTLGPAGGNIRMIAGNYGCFIRNDGAHTYFLLTNAGDQYGGWNSLRPLYINDATGYVTFGNGHGDLAENYRISGRALRGSLMSVNSAIPSAAIKADPSRKSLLGVISTTPGAVMDTDGGFHIGYGTKSEYKNEKAPIVLAGAAPVLVTSKNGPISIGDPVGISSIPGFGAKANTAGLTVGRALEVFNPKGSSCKAVASIEAIKWPEDSGKNSRKPCFKLPDGTYVGKIMVAVNVSWYDPSAGAPDPNKEMIKEMRSNIADLTAAVKAQQREIQALKQEINKSDKNQ